MRNFSSAVATYQAGLPTQACPANNNNYNPVYLPVTTCPPGFQGADCKTDINECLRGTDDCDLNAACVNTTGSFQCQCFSG